MRAYVLFLAFAGFASAGFASTLPVNLGTAGDFTVLGESLVSAGTTVSVVGNVGIYPAAATYITGFGLIADPSNQFDTSSLVNGRVYASDFSPPTPSVLDTAVGDMNAAYAYAAGQAPTQPPNLVLNGSPLAPGVYQWTSGLAVQSDLTLAGGSSGVWIFQIAGTLSFASGVKVILSGGAQGANVFWQVSGQTTLGTTSVVYGDILDQTAIVLDSGAGLNGKALAQTEVTLGSGSKAVSLTNGFFGVALPPPGRTFAYPSPANGGYIHVVYTMDEPGTARIRVYNAAGELVASADESEPAGVQQSLISVAGFAPGVYLYKAVLDYGAAGSQSLAVQKFGVQK